MRYWIGVACRDHVKIGEQGGFCQLCHGKERPLRRMSPGDWIIYYSSKQHMGDREPYQRFTAIGEVYGEQVYPYRMRPGFVPYRRDVRFVDAREVDIRPLIEELDFIRNKQRWGGAFRFGHLEIGERDFKRIAVRMLGADRLREEIDRSELATEH